MRRATHAQGTPQRVGNAFDQACEHAHCARRVMERRLVPGQGRIAGWLPMRHSCRTTNGPVRVRTEDDGDAGYGGVRQGPIHGVKPCWRVSNHDEVALRRARSERRECRV
ncbi:hypothetical protein D3C78_1358000 [compost metagenome]